MAKITTKDVEKYYKTLNVDKFRPIPFWSWNDKLEIPELIRQIGWMKEQGFGGYFMHARGGLTTEYLSDEWFDCIEACVDEGDRLGMESWAYDENGWPSGFVGGKLLEEIENHDRYIYAERGKIDKKALISYKEVGDELVKVVDGEGDDYINVYQKYSTSSADILNPEVVDKFLAQTHEEYKRRLGEKFSKSLKGFFTDEPQYYRWAVPYTKMLEKYFLEEYGENVIEGLGLMFFKKKGYRQFRYKYYKGMQKLMLKNFAQKIYDWCESNGTCLTGHYVQEDNLLGNMMGCAGIMPFYEYESIPGIDHLRLGDNSPVSSKQVSSVARQLGKSRVITETFGCCGWDVTPTRLKRIAEKQYVNGVNVMCQHLLPYSEHGQRKRDYPPHFSWVNPWVKEDFKSFNDYFARLGALLCESQDKTSVAVFCPVRSMYLNYKRDQEDSESKEVSDSYDNLCLTLSQMNVSYHIVDETIMQKHGSVKDGKLVVGKCQYDYLLFSKVLTMDKETEQLLNEYYAQGGAFIFTQGLPKYLEGEEHEYKFRSNCMIEQVISAQEYTVSDYSTQVQSTMRTVDGKKFIFATNLSDKEVDLTFTGDFNGFIELDLLSGETKKRSNTVHFDGEQSHVLFLTDEKIEGEKKKKEFTLKGKFNVIKDSGNYLTLDKLEYSLDGKNYSKKMRYFGVFNQLLEARHNGEVYLRYTFNAKSKPNSIYFLTEDMHVKNCYVNGKEITLSGQSDFEKKIYKTDITDLVIAGENQVVLKINFYESDNVYYVLFGDDVQEGLKNCLAYDTTIESCYLQGDFGVYTNGTFTDGKTKGIVFADDFYIDKKNSEVSDFVREGYPFFAGDVTIEKEFVGEKSTPVLNLLGNYSLAQITLNGKPVKKNYFDKKVDLSEHLVDGKNVIRIRFLISNRNLLGMHHYKEFEIPPFVGPEQFENPGTWVDGKSSKERDDYVFSRFGLFE